MALILADRGPQPGIPAAGDGLRPHRPCPGDQNQDCDYKDSYTGGHISASFCRTGSGGVVFDRRYHPTFLKSQSNSPASSVISARRSGPTKMISSWVLAMGVLAV